jgi:hypothetical protein
MVTELTTDIEVRRQPFTAVEVLDLVENLHVREELRKYQAQYNDVYVGPSGQIEGVIRAKRQLTPLECRDTAATMFPRAAYFVAQPGMFLDAKAIGRKLRACAEALQNPSLGQSFGGAYLKVEGIWVPSVGTLLLRQSKK